MSLPPTIPRIMPVNIWATRDPNVFRDTWANGFGCGAPVAELSFTEAFQRVKDHAAGRRSEVRRCIADLRYRKSKLAEAISDRPRDWMYEARIEARHLSIIQGATALRHKWWEYRHAMITLTAWEDAAMIRRTEGLED